MKQNKSLLLLLQIIIIFIACKSQHQKETVEINTAINKNIGIIPIDSIPYYFPFEKFRDTTIYVGHDTFINNWYSEHLFAMKEPIIYLNKSDAEIFRFTWLRTFNQPVSIRIEKYKDEYSLNWKICDGAGGYEPGKLIKNKQKEIKKEEWQTFNKMVNNINFWNLKTNKKTYGSDGSQWILEGKTKDKYHVVDRWSPNEKEEYYSVCNYLIELTNLKIKDRDKY